MKKVLLESWETWIMQGWGIIRQLGNAIPITKGFPRRYQIAKIYKL